MDWKFVVLEGDNAVIGKTESVQKETCQNCVESDCKFVPHWGATYNINWNMKLQWTSFLFLFGICMLWAWV